MSLGTATRSAAILVCACACACVGPHTRAVEETHAGLLGLDGRALRACLGVPSEFTIDGDLEQQTYRFDHADAFDELDRYDVLGGGMLGSRRPADRAYDPDGFPRVEPDRSFCQLDFELTRGRVTRVSAQGLTREGINADGSCLLRAEPCLDYGDGGRAPDEE
jgi:hypothetical protein